MNVRIMTSTILCMALALSAGLLADEKYPQWSELEKLFGKNKDSNPVKSVVTKWKLDEITKGPSGSFSPDNSSYRLMYDKSKISTIILDVLPPPKGYGEDHWTEYKQKLPFGIQKSDKKADFVMRFGKSKSKTGTFFQNKRFEIWAHFREKDGALEALYISPLESKIKKAKKGKPIVPQPILNSGDFPNPPGDRK